MDPPNREKENWYISLVHWITYHGGNVSDAVGIESNTTGPIGDRKVVAKQNLTQGQCIAKIPFSIVLHGADMPHSYMGKDNQPLHTSSWVKCLAALLFHLASRTTTTEQSPSHIIDFSPYVHSLPNHYDTLIHSHWGWSDEDIQCYLGGTALGDTMLQDRMSQNYRKRFENQIQPYLQSIQGLSDVTLQKFLNASAALCTRGFHSSSSSVSDTTKDALQGPYLIPFIDLLNHTNDTQNKCAVMFREGHCFNLVATRDIDIGEEILHSYGDELNSSQLLQTFGFVSMEAMDCAMRDEYYKKDNIWITPAILTKEEIISACNRVIESTFPQELQREIESNRKLTNSSESHCDEDEEVQQEVWQVPTPSELILRNQQISHLFPDHFLIQGQEEKDLISDELVTFCCFQFLHDTVIQTLVSDVSGTQSSTLSLLSSDVLEDYYLGRLVYCALQDAVERRIVAYPCLTWNPVNLRAEMPSFSVEEKNGTKQYNEDKKLLSCLMHQLKDMSSRENCEEHNQSAEIFNHEPILFGVRKAMYGLTIRLEEKYHLKRLSTLCIASSSVLQEDYRLQWDDERINVKDLELNKKRRLCDELLE